MILFFTLIYIALLMLAFRRKLLQPSLLWKLSPLVFALFLMIALFIPLQFWAPSGPVVAGYYTIPIIPQVQGVVTEVKARPNVKLSKGDPLFEMDKTLFQADVHNLEAGLELARTRLRQSEQLVASNAGSKANVEQYASQVAQLEENLVKARYNLEAATARAPADGYATNIALRPGTRVVAFPMAPAMTFLDTSELVVGTLIAQNQLRYIEPGQTAEIAFKIYPGRVFRATVKQLVPARATGYESQVGLPVIPQAVAHAPFGVQLILGQEAQALDLPSGATGRVTIYSGKGSFAHIVRKIELRIEAITNYFNPF
jgi:multidrug resistance efflux pump